MMPTQVGLLSLERQGLHAKLSQIPSVKFLQKRRQTRQFHRRSYEFEATFGKFERSGCVNIQEKLDTDGTGDELVFDLKFVNMVRNMGVAHWTRVNLKGTVQLLEGA